MEEARHRWGEAELHDGGNKLLEKMMASPAPERPAKLRMTKPKLNKAKRRAKNKAAKRARRHSA